MEKNNKLDQLTGLRYFAALLVFLSHLNWNGSNVHLGKIFESGYVGVSFFFLLSGFVLSYSYREKILNRQLNFIKYALLRLARLTPLHFLTASPFIFLAIHNGDISIFKMAINLSFLQSWVPNSTYYFSFNAPSWSLSNEMFFYICFFPLVFLDTRLLLKFFVALLALITFSAFGVEILYSEQKLFGESTFAHWLFYIFPGFRLLEFVVGMLLFKLWESRFRLPSWIVMPSYALLVVSMYFAKEVPEPFRFSLFFLPCIALFFYAHLTEESIFSRFFSTKVMVLLGSASFAFYLIHQPLIDIVRRLTWRLSLSNFSFFFISCSVITLLSIATYIIYERKSEAYLKQLTNNKFK